MVVARPIVATLFSVVLASCGVAVTRTANSFQSCSQLSTSSLLAVHQGQGVRLILPPDAKGPIYEFDDPGMNRPTWYGPKWKVHFVFGTDQLPQGMRGGFYCSLDDASTRRLAFVRHSNGRGSANRYGVVADIWHERSPDRVTSISISLEPGGLSEEMALSIVASASTTWDGEE